MKHLILLVLLSLSALSLAAQSNVEKAVARIEKAKSTSYVACSESRNPKTHKLVKVSKVMVINAKQAQEFKDAFNRDREKAVSMQMSMGRVYELRFEEKGKRSCYTLIQQRDGSWLLTVEMVSGGGNSPARRTSHNTSGEIPAGYVGVPDLELPGIILPELPQADVDLGQISVVMMGPL